MALLNYICMYVYIIYMCVYVMCTYVTCIFEYIMNTRLGEIMYSNIQCQERNAHELGEFPGLKCGFTHSYVVQDLRTGPVVGCNGTLCGKMKKKEHEGTSLVIAR